MADTRYLLLVLHHAAMLHTLLMPVAVMQPTLFILHSRFHLRFEQLHRKLGPGRHEDTAQAFQERLVPMLTGDPAEKMRMRTSHGSCTGTQSVRAFGDSSLLLRLLHSLTQGDSVSCCSRNWPWQLVKPSPAVP